jgi:hypothetical protein
MLPTPSAKRRKKKCSGEETQKGLRLLLRNERATGLFKAEQSTSAKFNRMP